jgi:hypothetical protein
MGDFNLQQQATDRLVLQFQPPAQQSDALAEAKQAVMSLCR